MTMTPRVLATRETGVMDQPQDHEHDPAAKPRRRTFTAEKKLALLAEYDAADRDGKGALLRREAIYSSHISEWRKQWAGRSFGEPVSSSGVAGLVSARQPSCAVGWLTRCHSHLWPSRTRRAGAVPRPDGDGAGRRATSSTG
jgi:hypothetical protein